MYSKLAIVPATVGGRRGLAETSPAMTHYQLQQLPNSRINGEKPSAGEKYLYARSWWLTRSSSIFASEHYIGGVVIWNIDSYLVKQGIPTTHTMSQMSAQDQAIVKAMPGNDKCAECGMKNPQWASVSFGTVFCLECSGVHRYVMHTEHIVRCQPLEGEFLLR